MVPCMRSPWPRLAALLALALAIKFHWAGILDPWRIDGDARQHVFWTYRYADPGLFPNDPLVDFIASPRFDPPGYSALYAVGVRVLDALIFSKLLGLALCSVVAWAAYRLGKRWGGDLSGFLAVLAAGGLMFDNLRGGLPRAFAFPILLLGLLAVAGKRRFAFGLTFVVAALFYPPMIFNLAALALFFLPSLLRTPWATILRLGGPTLVAAGITLASYGGGGEADFGRFIDAETAKARPEFQENGRAEFWVEDSVRFWLGDWSYNRSACGLLSNQVMLPLLGLLLVAVVRRKKFVAPPLLGWLFLSGGLLFLLAHALLFRLFLPSRYTLYAWPAALGILLAINLGTWIGDYGLLVRHRGRVRAAMVGLTLLVLASLLAGSLAKSKAPEPDEVALYEAISALPNDCLVAGRPEVLDDVPLRSRRRVLINRELSLPYYEHHDRRVRERTEASLHLGFGSDANRFRDLAAHYGVTHLVIEKALVENLDWPSLAVVDAPHDRLLDELRKGAPFALSEAAGLPVCLENRRYWLLAIPR